MHYVRPRYRVLCEFDGVNNKIVILDPRERRTDCWGVESRYDVH